MATIRFTYDEKDYTLGFNRRTAEQMSDSGFTLDKFADDTVGYRRRLFAGAFLQYHRTTPQNVIDDIWEHFPNKSELLNALVDMYAETVNTIFAEPSEDDAKKFNWEVVK